MDQIPASFYSSLPIVLMAIACAMGVFAVAKLVLKTRPKDNEEWRDPPPIIYKLFKPIVRLFSGEVRKLLSDANYAKTQTRLSAGGMNYAILPEEFVTLRFVCAVFCGSHWLP